MARKKKEVIDEINDTVDQIKADEEMVPVDDHPPVYTLDDLIPTGSTVLNLACSDNPFGGYRKGTMVNLIGDSSSGKTLLALTGLAMMCQNKRFDKYKIHFNDAETALGFNIPKLFGNKLAERIDTSHISNGVEDFYGWFYKLLKKGEPFVAIVDSWDALRTIEEEERAKQYAKDPTKVKGTFGASKQKMASEIFRNVVGDIRNTESLLIIISQTRDNLNAGLFGNTKIRSGGNALKFYAYHEIWLAVLSKEYKQVRGTKYEIGIDTLMKVNKNKLSGKKRNGNIPIFYDYGVHDFYSCIDYLVKTGEWKKNDSGAITPTGLIEGSYKRDNLASIIAQDNKFGSMQELVWDVWNDIENKLAIDLPRRFE